MLIRVAHQHNNFQCRLRLDLAVQVEPVQGRIVDDRGSTEIFVGWLDLVELLESHRRGRARDEADPSSP